MAIVDRFPDQGFAFRSLVEDADDDMSGRVTELTGIEIVLIRVKTETVKKIGMMHRLTLC